MNDINRGQLISIIERIERLEDEKKGIAGDIKEVYGEAKANGYDTKILRKVIAIRKQDAAERQEQEALLDLYLRAIAFDSTPLGRAAQAGDQKPADDVAVTIEAPGVEPVHTTIEGMKKATAALNKRSRGKKPPPAAPAVSDAADRAAQAPAKPDSRSWVQEAADRAEGRL